MQPTFDVIVYGGIFALAIALAIAMAIGWTVRMAQHSKPLGQLVGASIAGIALLGGIASYAGLFTNTAVQPPLFVVVESVLLLGFVGFAMSARGLVFANAMPWKVLVGLQVFRLPLELLMLRAALVGIMPKEFSMLGYNFDVLSGVLSLALLIYMSKTGQAPRTLLWIWNSFGIACLCVIAVLAALTSPNIHAFGAASEHINTWVLYFPYAYLPLLLVNFAVMGHVLSTRKLLKESS
jgi:hypothetical protein